MELTFTEIYLTLAQGLSCSTHDAEAAWRPEASSRILAAMMTMQRRAIAAVLVAGLISAGAASCGDDSESSETIEPEPGETAEDHGDPNDPVAERNREVREALSDSRVHLDLLATAHLADVDHHGPYLDFGTPARMHYTMGRWHNGFLSDVSAGDRDFTRMGTDARAWVHLDEARPITLRFRGRPIGSDAVVVYLNGQRAGQIDFEGQGVQEHDVAIEESLVRAGENTFMFRAAETRSVQGEDVAAEVDSIWLLDAPSEELAAPRFSQMVREVDIAGDARRAVVLAPQTTVRWYAEVPEDGQLSFAVGAVGDGDAEVLARIRAEGGGSAEETRIAVSRAWREKLIDLSGLAGDVVRIELSTTGDAEGIAFAGPAIVVPMPERALADAESPSVVLLLIDTLRASKLRAYNPGSRVRTPTLDAFAEQAAVFDHAQAPENWTKPSVASVLTSLHPVTHNTKEQSSALPASALTVAEVFQQNDFATASFIANGYVSDRFGFDQGWDHYTNYIRENRNTEAENVFGEAAAWIEQHREERFFAYIQTIDPHVPYDPPDELVRSYDSDDYDGPIRPRATGNLLDDVKAGRATLTARDRQRLAALHDGEITYHDQQMARFIERLREMEIYDRILFVVTSDHGEEFYEHESYGHGHSIFQELLHVPLMMRWPNVIAPRRFGPTVSTLDIAPTLLTATGVDLPDVFEGYELLSTARGLTRPGPAIAFSDKLDDRRVATAAGYKLVVRANLTWAMFNLREDPSEQEQIDRGDRHPIALRYLRGLYGQFLGANDRRDWLTAGTGARSRVLPSAESEIDAELCRQLLRLRYVDPRCADIL